MKKVTFIVLISCLSILTAFAQPRHKKGHRHEKPTPVNEHEDKFKALKKEYKPTKRPDFEGASDAEVQQMIDKHFEFKQKQLDLEKEYASKFAEVLPLRKVIMLNHLERKFRHKIIKELKKRKE